MILFVCKQEIKAPSLSLSFSLSTVSRSMYFEMETRGRQSVRGGGDCGAGRGRRARDGHVSLGGFAVGRGRQRVVWEASLEDVDFDDDGRGSGNASAAPRRGERVAVRGLCGRRWRFRETGEEVATCGGRVVRGPRRQRGALDSSALVGADDGGRS